MFCPDAVVWGTVGEWVAGIGAVIAVGVSVLFAIRAERARETAQDALRVRESQDEEDARTRQARGISLWKGIRSPESEGEARFLSAVSTLEVHNASDLPVFNAEVLWRIKDGAGGGLRESLSSLDAIAPGTTRQVSSWWEPVGTAWVRFTDLHDVTWWRGTDGTLTSDRAEAERLGAVTGSESTTASGG